MTRVISALLGAQEPQFSIAVQRMERAAGNPSTDVRLSAELIQRARAKVQELGLDPQDTTSQELYRALEERIGQDDLLVRRTLSIADNATAAEITQAVVRYVETRVSVEYNGFALKHSVTKRLLKKHAPKRAMKQLNYRSVDSFLKHESAEHVFVAAFVCESVAWRKKLVDSYSKLKPGDFETRSITISTPQSERWAAVSTQATNSQRHNIFVTKEMASIVVLPLEKTMPGLAITTLVLVLNALNDVMSIGSFLKLQQVKSDFGAIVRSVVIGDPVTAARLDDQPLPWKTIHQHYARNAEIHPSTVFEPHISASDLKWHHPESVLSTIDPALTFWRDTRYTGFLHGTSFVSMNVLDVAINYCNKLGFADRVTDFLQQHLWQEFTLRYLNHENIEQAISSELSPQLAFAEAPSPNDFE